MAKKTVGYIKLIWTCPRCETRNPGPNRFCNGCGAPQPEDVQFEQPAEAELLKNADEIARAKAGPDIHCPYCGTRTPAGVKFCGACGGDLAEGKARAKGRVVGAYKAPSGATRPCPACGTANPLTSVKCSNCGSALPTETKAAASAGAAPTGPARGKSGLLIGGLAAGLCAVGAVALLLLSQRRTEIPAVVQRVAWERTIAVEAFGPVEHQDWRDDLPADASGVACRLEHRTNQDDPAPVSTEVCGTPYTIDDGTGFGEVVQDCTYEVYDEMCTYTVDEWSVVETAGARGDDLDLIWPDLSLQSGEREGVRHESFIVHLVGGDETLTYAPATFAEFAAFAPGTEWLVVVDGEGAIVAVEPR